MLQHLRDRGMNPDLYPYAGFTPDVATFPMYNFGAKLTGLQQYRPDGEKKAPNHPREGRYYSYVSPNEYALFGLESFYYTEQIYLVGGLFKAATLHRLGYTALHVSAVSYKFLKPQLELIGRPYFALGDNDEEGAEFVRRYGGLVCPSDVDELPDPEVHMLVLACQSS